MTPSEEEWLRMTPQRREEFQLEVLAALSDPRDLMSEGRPHKRAKSRALDMLGLHFKTLGVVYLAEEMAVMYPGEEAFSPDVLAVLERAATRRRPRLAWVVANERRGLDLCWRSFTAATAGRTSCSTSSATPDSAFLSTSSMTAPRNGSSAAGFL
ncbi:MAG: hypothetical protein R3A52_27910 [Polyangiales bacterium]